MTDINKAIDEWAESHRQEAFAELSARVDDAIINSDGSIPAAAAAAVASAVDINMRFTVECLKYALSEMQKYRADA